MDAPTLDANCVPDRRPKQRRYAADTFDGRTRRAKRFRTLIEGFSADFGASGPGPRERALIEQAAAVIVQCEVEQARIVRGEAIDLEQLTRLTNVLARSLKELGLKDARKDRRPNVDEYLARKGMAK